MLFAPNTTYFNELEINGEHVDDGDNEDFTTNNQNAEEDESEPEDNDTTENQDDAGNDDLEDFTEDEFDDSEVNDDTNQDETEPADNTEENSEPENNDDANQDDTDDTTEDNQDDTGNDLEDFTEDDFTDDGGDNQEDDANTEETNTDGDGAEDNTDNTEDKTESDNSSGETLADMEKNLFSDLTPNQMAIKNNELLQNYIELYETINIIFDNINKIPKTYENTRPLTFIADQLIDLKDMVNYVITDTYVTKTYVENMAYYKQSLVVLSQINTMLKALIQKPAK